MVTPPRDRKAEPRDETLERLGRVSVIGTNFAFTVMGGALLGWLLDRWLGSSPVGIIVGAASGLLGGSVRFVSEARLLLKPRDRGGPGKPHA